MSKRLNALGVLRGRLQAITIANGFNTDAGKAVFLGELPVLGEDDPAQAIAIVVGPDEIGHQGEKLVVNLPVDVQALVPADADDPWTSVEAIVSDIKRAVEIDSDPNRDLGRILIRQGLERGSTRPLDRESGSGYVGAAVTYRVTFSEVWGAP
jgi:hypothetical protein